MTTPAERSRSATSAARLEELYVRNTPAALRLAYFLSGDRETAQDLVQDAFVKVAGRFAHLRTPDAFDAYLRRTIVNLFTSQLRRRRLERAHLARERGAVASPHVDEDPALRDELWRALGTLPARQRAAVVLRYYEDLSEKETAEVLRCSVGAANQLVTRGMAALRDHIGGRER
ncbi:MAG: SigE family RNA polymerase sigma factor [Actinomycetota bacterium]